RLSNRTEELRARGGIGGGSAACQGRFHTEPWRRSRPNVSAGGVGRGWKGRTTVPSIVRIKRRRGAGRSARGVATLGGRDYALSPDAICRYAYTPVYGATVAYFAREFEQLGFEVFGAVPLVETC